MSLMLEEIREQPGVLERTLAAERPRYTEIRSRFAKLDIDMIVIAARGSSDNAALFGRYLLEVATGIPVSLSAPAVFTLYDGRPKLDRALVIGVSQSGEGPDVNCVVKRARESGALTLAITNDGGSTLAGLADEVFLIHAGREKSVAATKTYTGQLLHFYMLAEALGAIVDDIDSIADRVRAVLALDAHIEEIAQRYAFMENCVVVGRGYNYGNAFELGLKLMETCYVVAERFSTADFHHGPVAVVERRFPVILFAPGGRTKPGSVELLTLLNELGADSLAITNDAEVAELATVAIMIAEPTIELLTPIPFIIPAQLFAAYLAEAKGLDPDSPRSLSKITKTI